MAEEARRAELERQAFAQAEKMAERQVLQEKRREADENSKREAERREQVQGEARAQPDGLARGRPATALEHGGPAAGVVVAEVEPRDPAAGGHPLGVEAGRQHRRLVEREQVAGAEDPQCRQVGDPVVRDPPGRPVADHQPRGVAGLGGLGGDQALGQGEIEFVGPHPRKLPGPPEGRRR